LEFVVALDECSVQSSSKILHFSRAQGGFRGDLFALQRRLLVTALAAVAFESFHIYRI